MTRYLSKIFLHCTCRPM